ncbi:hypothetical protein Fot_37651 [Forsythia ovata]|uniref:Uncharacterized protein n=1 Tax=Forsythia ovata TaxID=205694 RepID=A0ABD1RZK4_9LAMI
MSDKDRNTHIRQTNERSDGKAEGAPEVAQSPRRGRHPRAHLERNMELMVAQMLEMHKQQAAQTAIFNAYLHKEFMSPAPSVYPSYRLGGYEDQHDIHTNR